MASLSIKPVTSKNWPDMEKLFEGKSCPKYCWCMAWRPFPKGPRPPEPAKRKAALHKFVQDGTPVGIIGYLQGEPVAWCSIAPRETYRNLGGIKEEGDEGKVWSLVCFFIVKAHRQQGYARQLISAAIDYSKANGANVVEAYPVMPDSPSYRFMGQVSLFKAAGFDEVGLAGTRRHVMRRKIT